MSATTCTWKSSSNTRFQMLCSLSHLQRMFQWFLRLIPDRAPNLRTIWTKTNFSLKSDWNNFSYLAGFARRSFNLSLGQRPHTCLIIDETFSMCGTQSVDFWRWCGQISFLPWVSQLPEATSLLLLLESSGKFKFSPGLLLSRRVTSYLTPELHFFPILEPSTLRLDWVRFFKFPCTWPVSSPECLQYHWPFRRKQILQSKNM